MKERTQVRSRQWSVRDNVSLTGSISQKRFIIECSATRSVAKLRIGTAAYAPHAYMMAAAPQLFKALDHLMREVATGKPICISTLQKASDALAKAEGRRHEPTQ